MFAYADSTSPAYEQSSSDLSGQKETSFGIVSLYLLRLSNRSLSTIRPERRSSGRR